MLVDEMHLQTSTRTQSALALVDGDAERVRDKYAMTMRCDGSTTEGRGNPVDKGAIWTRAE